MITAILAVNLAIFVFCLIIVVNAEEKTERDEKNKPTAIYLSIFMVDINTVGIVLVNWSSF